MVTHAEEDVALLMYTSGRVRVPKAAIHSYRSVPGSRAQLYDVARTYFSGSPPAGAIYLSHQCGIRDAGADAPKPFEIKLSGRIDVSTVARPHAERVTATL